MTLSLSLTGSGKSKGLSRAAAIVRRLMRRENPQCPTGRARDVGEPYDEIMDGARAIFRESGCGGESLVLTQLVSLLVALVGLTISLVDVFSPALAARIEATIRQLGKLRFPPHTNDPLHQTGDSVAVEVVRDGELKVWRVTKGRT